VPATIRTGINELGRRKRPALAAFRRCPGPRASPASDRATSPTVSPPIAGHPSLSREQARTSSAMSGRVQIEHPAAPIAADHCCGSLIRPCTVVPILPTWNLEASVAVPLGRGHLSVWRAGCRGHRITCRMLTGERGGGGGGGGGGRRRFLILKILGLRDIHAPGTGDSEPTQESLAAQLSRPPVWDDRQSACGCTTSCILLKLCCRRSGTLPTARCLDADLVAERNPWRYMRRRRRRRRSGQLDVAFVTICCAPSTFGYCMYPVYPDGTDRGLLCRWP